MHQRHRRKNPKGRKLFEKVTETGKLITGEFESGRGRRISGDAHKRFQQDGKPGTKQGNEKSKQQALSKLDENSNFGKSESLDELVCLKFNITIY